MRTLTVRAVATAAPTLTPETPRTRLTREQREAWVMALYLGGATIDEIAFALGSARTSIRNTVLEAGLARHRAAKNIDVLVIMREVPRATEPASGHRTAPHSRRPSCE